MITGKRRLTEDEHDKILAILKARFEKNMNRHEGIEWEKIQNKL